MNIAFFYSLTRLFQSIGKNLITFGLFGLGEGKLSRKQIEELPFYNNPAIIPFAWNFIINQTLIIVFANIEVSIFPLLTFCLRSTPAWPAQTFSTTGSSVSSSPISPRAKSSPWWRRLCSWWCQCTTWFTCASTLLSSLMSSDFSEKSMLCLFRWIVNN